MCIKGACKNNINNIFLTVAVKIVRVRRNVAINKIKSGGRGY